MKTLTLMFPDGSQVSTASVLILGREDFRGLVDDDEVALISKKHLRVSERDGIFWLEDGVDGVPSANGTTLNGQDIRGENFIPLRDGDTIGIGGTIDLKVRIR